MNYLCAVPGCQERAATQYGKLCNAHRSRARRHGDARQEAITKADLRLYEQQVQHRIDRNKNSEIWSQLEARWAALVKDAQEVLRQSRSGQPMFSWRRTVAVEVVKLSNTVEPKAVIKMVLAFYLMQDQEPRKFRSDKAFRTQLVRRVRGLTTLNAGTWKDAATGKTKVAYRELNAKAVDLMARQLEQAFGPTGVTIAGLERKDEERKRQEVLSHHNALGGLQ